MPHPDESAPETVTLLDCLLLATTAAAFSEVPLQAYIDPGTGSYLFQLAAAGLLAGLYTVKRFWGNLKRFFGSRQKSGPDEN